MTCPRIDIHLDKIGHNAKKIKALYNSKGIEIAGVTKVICGNPTIAKTLVASGINTLADSRISNIQKMQEAGVEAQFILLRIPLLSEIKEVVRFANISLNSEFKVIEKLSQCALKLNKIHKVILMVELGDLREGILPIDLPSFIEKLLTLKGIQLVGIGTNLACFGGVKPNHKNMHYLSTIANNIEDQFNLKLEFISGGNSANYNWFINNNNTERINNLRIGESIFLGVEPLERKAIPGLFTDAFTLVTEVIESKIKPSEPTGEIFQNVSGNIPDYKDQGLIKRAILGIGIQDVDISGLTPLNAIEIIGASSDHLIVNAKETKLDIGTEVRFQVNYGALLSAINSAYVIKNIV